MRGRQRRGNAVEMQRRSDFVGRLLDRGATRQQVLEALTRAPSEDPGKPGGLGLGTAPAIHAYNHALKRRGEVFREEQRLARQEQAMRIRGHISGAVAAKQYGPVAALERGYARLFGTDAVAPAPTRGERRDLIADALAGMTDEQIRALAGEDEPEEDR